MPEPIPHLPDDWSCNACGETARDFAVIRPLAEADVAECDLIEAGERFDGMFTNGAEIEVCGCCGEARWSKPVCAAI